MSKHAFDLRAAGLAVAASIFGFTTASAAVADAAKGGSDAATGDTNATQLEEVVVTGTSIKGLNAETALPVQVLKADDIARTGADNVEQLFRQLTAASSAGTTVAAQATGFGTGSISTVSLRGLGSGRTLILINGRRSAVYGGGSIGVAGDSVDISAIPIAAIERVEILKDGASAIYGSDAIAGVVNFILKKDFRGLQVDAGAGTPTRAGGGQEQHASVFGGMGDLKTDGFNIDGGINFEHMTALAGKDRSFASRYAPQYGNDVTSTFAFPGNVTVPGHGFLSPAFPNCGPASFVSQYFPGRCRLDNSPYDSLEPEQQKLSGMVNASLRVGDNATLYGEASYSQVKTQTTVQPVLLGQFAANLAPTNPYVAYLNNLLATQYPTYNSKGLRGTSAFLLPPSSPYYPAGFAAQYGLTGQPLNVSFFRDFPNGQRQEGDTADTSRVVAGIKGTAGGWDYDTALLFSGVTVSDNLFSGFAQYSKILPLLDQGNINPFGPTTDPTQIAAAKATEFVGTDYSTRTSIASASGTASRTLFDLPAGPLKAAVGAEFRHETFKFDPSAAVQGGDIAGLGGNQLPESAARNVESAFVEFNAPIVQHLDGDVAVRYDNYQRVGSTVNPKASLRWQPESWLLLRTSAGTGFRAPSLTDLYAAQATSVTSNGTRDPIQCPTFNANNPACSFQFNTITGGNPNLQPEKSTTLTFGTVLQPIDNLSIDLDSFWIYLKDSIVVGGLPYSYFLQNAQTATQYAYLINRDANGNIVSIAQTNQNLFKTNVSGLDFDIKYAFNLGNAGRLNLMLDGTYFYKYASQNPDGSWTGQLDQGLGSGGLISRARYVGVVDYQVGSWDASLTQNWQKKYHDSLSNVTQVGREVSAYDTVDGQLSYLGLESFKFTVGARNLFDKNPPYANYAAAANNFIGGYDLSYGDPLGRFVYFNVTYKMH